jgi:hypothetical protein
VREVQNESAVGYKTYKLLYFLFGFWGWPLRNPGNLDWVHFYFTVQNDKSKVFYASAFELTFVMSEEELVFSEDVQDFSDDLAMFIQVFGEDEDVIYVYTYDAVADEVLENVIHHSLEGGQAMSHAV